MSSAKILLVFKRFGCFARRGAGGARAAANVSVQRRASCILLSLLGWIALRLLQLRRTKWRNLCGPLGSYAAATSRSTAAHVAARSQDLLWSITEGRTRTRQFLPTRPPAVDGTLPAERRRTALVGGDSGSPTALSLTLAAVLRATAQATPPLKNCLQSTTTHASIQSCNDCRSALQICSIQRQQKAISL